MLVGVGPWKSLEIRYNSSPFNCLNRSFRKVHSKADRQMDRKTDANLFVVMCECVVYSGTGNALL